MQNDFLFYIINLLVIAAYILIPSYGPESFPLDRAWWLRGDVVDDAVDAAYLVDDAGCRAAEEVHVVRIEIRRHTIDRGDRAQRADEVIGPMVAHDADGLHRQKHGEGL